MSESRPFAILLGILPLLLATNTQAVEERPYWVEPMKKAHARFTGTPGTLALLGDSITVSLAFWAPLENEPRNTIPVMRHAHALVKDYLKPDCWSKWRGAEYGNEGSMTIRWADQNLDRWLKKLNPEVALVMFGTNDLTQVPLAEYEQKTTSVVQRCLKNGTIVILTTIPPRSGLLDRARQYAEAVRRVGRAQQVPVIDFFAEVLKRRPDDWDGTLSKFKTTPGNEYQVPTLIARDGVHPSFPEKYLDFSEDSLRNNGFNLRSYLSLLAYADVIQRLKLKGQAIGDSSRPREHPAQENTKVPRRKTEVTIEGEMFCINGQPTYKGRTWNGKKIEGLLLNSRMVQAIFDDRNPETVNLWKYPDTEKWDPERNTREFIAAMPTWRRHGLLGMTLNLQGGSPQGYSTQQPWHNSALREDGRLRADYLSRLQRVLDKADELGMVVILGLFYFGQDERLRGEAAVQRGVDDVLDWLFDRGYRNILIEVNNECNVRYDHAILRPKRVHELIERAKKRTRDGRRFLVGTSYGGGVIPQENVARVSDFLLLHGNGVKNPDRIAAMVRQTRRVSGYRPMPILFNEDDHFDFDQPRNNFVAAISEYASWGFFDFRMRGEGFDDGYQSVPVNWGAMSARKRGFFDLLGKITGERAGVKAEEHGRVFPGKSWATRTPAQAGLARCPASWTGPRDWRHLTASRDGQ